MIDTLKLGLVDYHVEPKNSVIVQPSPYRAATGELVSNFNLWADRDSGEIVQGSKAYFNDNKMNVSLTPQGEVTLCHVQLSLPKYHHGNNYYPIGRESTIEVLSHLEKHLGEIGIKCNIDNAKISRVDMAKTIVTEENFSDYRGVFSLLNARRTNLRDYGSTFLWYNGERELCVYNKCEEMKNNGEDISRYPANSMRFEYRLKKPRVIRKSFDFDTVGVLKKEYGHVCKVYSNSIRKDLFKYEMGDIEITCGNEIEQGLRHFKEQYGGQFYRMYLEVIGLKDLMRTCEYETIKEAFCNVLGYRMAKSRIIKRLDERKAMGAVFMKNPDSIKTYAVLYQEMKDKVFAAA